MIKTIIALSSRPYSIRELAAKHSVGVKTVRRDLAAIEDLNVPVYKTEFADHYAPGLFRVDRAWMRHFV